MHSERYQKLKKTTGGNGNKRKRRDHTENNITMIGQNTQKSSQYLIRIHTIRTHVNVSVKNSQGE